MISRQVYLLLTAGLLLLSIGTSFAMQDRKSPQRAALQALEAANLQLTRIKQKTPEQGRAQALIREAVQSLKER